MQKILVIDDDAAILEVVNEILKREGYEVASVTNAREALEKFQDGRFDLVITDLFMPDKEGLETILDLRRKDREVRIIAMSGGGSIGANDSLSMARKFGAKQTLTKPFSRSELLAAVAMVLGD